MRRIGLGVAFTLSLILAALAAQAQQTGKKLPRIGYLSAHFPSPRDEAFRRGLREFGYLEGQTVTIDYRFAEGRYERLSGFAAELVRLNVDVIVTAGDSEVRAAKQATRMIPIVMAVADDPVRSGYVSSLARPGGNITGQSYLSPDLGAKLLDVLKQAVPGVSRVAVLWNAANPVKGLAFEETQRAARTLGLLLSSIEMQKAPNDLETALAAIARAHPDALLTLADDVLGQAGVFTRIADFALRQRLPSISGDRQFAAAGVLIFYGPNVIELFRRAAASVAKILKGAKPADLPVEQPTKFELVINLKTAKALGLTIPQSVLLRADQVME